MLMRTTFAGLFFLLAFDLSAQVNPYAFSLEPSRSKELPALRRSSADKQLFFPTFNKSAAPLTTAALASGTGWSNAFTVPGVVDGYVYAMATDGTNLYIGGTFTVIGGTVANNVVRWDGLRWHSIGEGGENGVTGSVEALVFAGGKLFVGGAISKAGSKDVNSVAYWDGSEWHALGEGETNGVRNIIRIPDQPPYIGRGHVWSMHAHDDMLYIGGLMQLAGTDTTAGIAGWNVSTQTWKTFNGGLKSRYEGDNVYAMSFAVSGADLFVGGKFDSAGSVHARNIARWDGTGWSGVGGGANHWVRGLEVDSSGNLYAAGFFDSAGTTKVSGVAKWNRKSWSPIGKLLVQEEGSTYLPDVREVRLIDGNVYICGNFQQVNGNPASGLARWDGQTWHAIEGLGFTHGMWPGSVRTFRKVAGKIYVGGNFKTAGDILVSSLAVWNEPASTWELPTDGNKDKGIYDGAVYALGGSDDALYAGGSFTAAGGVYTKSIAKWTGAGWDHLSMGFINGIKGTVSAILVDGQNVYVGGSFGFAGSVEAYHIARWDGTTWSSLGIGVGGVSGASVDALLKVGDYLYVGGHFAVVGDDENYALPANAVARFHLKSQRWEALGGGIEYVEGFAGFVEALATDGTMIYAGGFFSRADKREAWSLAAWTGTDWSPVGLKESNGVDGKVSVLSYADKSLLVGGIFTIPTGEQIQSLASWDGVSWNQIGGGISKSDGSPAVFALHPYQGKLIIGGGFDRAGDQPVSNLAMWDGRGWNDLEGGVNGTVLGFATDRSKLVVGGSFTIAGGKPSVAFAQFDLLTTPVEGGEANAAEEFVVYQNYPNPFNPATNIRFSLGSAARVKISVFNLLGERVAQILDEARPAGTHTVGWNATNHPSGMYIGRVEIAGSDNQRVGRIKSFKMIVLK